MENLEDVNYDGSLNMEDLIVQNLEDVALHLQRFTSFDYVFFISMLFLCILIGVYFGFVKKRVGNSETEYLMGGRTMSIFPISLSLIAR